MANLFNSTDEVGALVLKLSFSEIRTKKTTAVQ